MWIHANVKASLGPLDYVINGPRLHRWHHAREIHDVNFATKLALWDWLFGTAYAPAGKRPESYGLDEAFPRNIVTQQLHAFRPMQKGAGEGRPPLPAPGQPLPPRTT
jgi:sterol desaturase/sphingolipid hydroxylase (fatty acid hydroxylase superfamily)